MLTFQIAGIGNVPHDQKRGTRNERALNSEFGYSSQNIRQSLPPRRVAEFFSHFFIRNFKCLSPKFKDFSQSFFSRFAFPAGVLPLFGPQFQRNLQSILLVFLAPIGNRRDQLSRNGISNRRFQNLNRGYRSHPFIFHIRSP